MTIEVPPINVEHFANLLKPVPKTVWRGHNPVSWVTSIRFKPDVVSHFDTHRQTREELRTFISRHKDPVVQFAAVMAWGGMRHRNGRKSLKSENTWRNLIADLSNPSISRSEAFQAFITHRKDRKSSAFLHGVGVAYFTKLLFFIRPTSDAYILDQWTGKSINLLFGDAANKHPIVKFDGNTISDRNTADDYERFCLCIEALAIKLAVSPSEAEERIFSNGGGNGKDGAWRAYVKNKWNRSQ